MIKSGNAGTLNVSAINAKKIGILVAVNTYMVT